jgi:hypothetical protein
MQLKFEINFLKNKQKLWWTSNYLFYKKIHTYIIDCLVYLKDTSSKQCEYALISGQIELSNHIVHCILWLII